MTSEKPPATIRLDETELACRTCGQRVTIHNSRATITATAVEYHPLGTVRATHRVQLGLCGDCQALEARADHLARAGGLDRQRGLGVMVAATLTSQPVEDGEGKRLARYVATIGHAAMWRSQVNSDAMEFAAKKPWSHAREQRKLAARGFADATAERVAAGQPDQQLPPPRAAARSGARAVDGGCLHCGVAATRASAGWVHRHGGPTAAAEDVWTPTTVDASSLNVKGGGTLSGHLCPACARVRADRGSGGQPVVEETYARHAGIKYRPDLDRLPGVVAYGAACASRGWGLAGNSVPWEHVTDG